MPMSDECAARSIFAAVPHTAGTGRGVIAIERDGLAIAHLAARATQLAQLTERFREHFGMVLPDGARRVAAHGVAVAGIAPQRWLLIGEDAGEEFVSGRLALLEHYAALVELSDAYAVLRLRGAQVRGSLAKLVPIDLHDTRFRPGDVAQTVLEHMPVTLWRLEDAPTGEPMIELAVGRSFAVSLYEALRESATEFGFCFEPTAKG